MRRRNWILVSLAAASLLLNLAQCARAAEVEVFSKLGHTSDLMRGCPLRCEVAETQQDYFAPIGVTIRAGKRRAWEIDLSHGFKWIDRGKRETGTEIDVKVYYGRFRGHVR